MSNNYSKIQPNAEIRAEYAEKCATCGACCVYYPSSNKWSVDAETFADQPPVPKRLVQIGPRREMGMYSAVTKEHVEDRSTNRHLRVIDGARPWLNVPYIKRCAAWDGEVGKKSLCTIYGQRPNTCQTYDPGSEDCRRVRVWAGIENNPEPAQSVLIVGVETDHGIQPESLRGTW